MKTNFKFFFICLIISANFINASAQEKEKPVRGGITKIGEIEHNPIHIEYSSTELQSKSAKEIVISHPQATYIKIHFSKLDLLPGHYITVSDPDARQVHTYPDKNEKILRTDFWAKSIIGDTAIVKLHFNAKSDKQLLNSEVYEKALTNGVQNLSDFGVVIDKYARGYSKAKMESLENRAESTCGSNQRTDVACFESSHPTEFNHSHAVARLIINGTGLCTGWRVGPDNHMLTNEHCISSQTDVNNLEIQFDYQRENCQTGTPNIPTIVTGNTFFVDNFNLDFALFSVNNFASIQSFGYLELDARQPLLNERIYIPQHGAGNPKEFGITSDFNTGNVCRIDDASTDGLATNVDTGYFCDTTGGSSGSPVLAASTNKVIALHHFGTGGDACNGSTMNQGVKISEIHPLIEPFLNGQSLADQYEPDDTPASASQIDLNTTQSHSIYPAGNSDWVKFTVTKTSTITIETFGPSGDTTLSLYQDDATTRITFDDDGGTDLFSRIVIELDPGDYFIKVDEYLNNDIIQSYRLSVKDNNESELCLPIKSTNNKFAVICL